MGRVMSLRKRREQGVCAAAISTTLCEPWPTCFSLCEHRRKPLKLNIDLEVANAATNANAAGTLNELGWRCGVCCQNFWYLRLWWPLLRGGGSCSFQARPRAARVMGLITRWGSNRTGWMVVRHRLIKTK